MPTGATRHPANAARFALRSVAGSLAFLGLLRVDWLEVHVLLPLTRAQGTLAEGLFGAPVSPVAVTLACSGAEALAVCFGATLAYPATWRMRLAGAGGGAALILVLNTLRIGTLGRVAASPAWFEALHLYVWPAVLTLAVVGYVFAWMRHADRPHMPGDDTPPTRPHVAAWRPTLSRQFVALTFVFLIAFSLAAPLYLESPGVFALAGLVARAAAATLDVFGVSTYAAANVLWTSHGGFLVTQECVVTPLIPIYLAAVLAYSPTWWRSILGIVATVPLFLVLAVVRLLVVALPASASPLFFVHAFHQLLLAALIVFLVALWRHGGRKASGPTLAGLAVGILFVCLLGPFYTRVVMYPSGMPLHDPQGAIALLPAFQIGLYLAIWIAGFMTVAWPRVLAGIAMLGLMQTAGLLALHSLEAHAGLTVSVPGIRGWAIVAPALILMAVAAGAWRSSPRAEHP